VRDRMVMPLLAAHLARVGSERDAWLTGHHIDWDSPVPA
jgi:FAD-dependent urate hydroxylase